MLQQMTQADGTHQQYLFSVTAEQCSWAQQHKLYYLYLGSRRHQAQSVLDGLSARNTLNPLQPPNTL
jgi:hypothetical protein